MTVYTQHGPLSEKTGEKAIAYMHIQPYIIDSAGRGTDDHDEALYLVLKKDKRSMPHEMLQFRLIGGMAIVPFLEEMGIDTRSDSTENLERSVRRLEGRTLMGVHLNKETLAYVITNTK